MARFCGAFVFAFLFAYTCHGHYFLGGYTHKKYSVGDMIFVTVNTLTSIQTQLPFSYYSLPYCEPQGGVKKSVMNLGQILMGDQVENSPYRFQMNVNETVFLCVKGPLTADEVELLKRRTRDLYQVNMILDSLPLTRLSEGYGMSFRSVGFPIVYTEHIDIDEYNEYIINHLKFRVLIHERGGTGKSSGYEIVGFEVVPHSMKHSPDDMSKLHMYENVKPRGPYKWHLIQENETVAFTYEVEFVKSDITWPDRRDASLEKGHDNIRRLSIFNSVITIFILAAVVFVIYWRTARRELIRNRSIDKEVQAQMKKEPLGWKLVAGDVFREPGCAKLLCVLVGEGIRITGAALATTVFAVSDLISPASRGRLLTSLIMLYLFFSVAAGYATVWLWRTIKGTSQGWKSVSWSVACFFPGIVSVVLMLLNLLLLSTRTTVAKPVFSCLILIALLFSISVPLALVGGFIATKTELTQFPVKTNHVPREIPAHKYLPWLLVLGARTLPFSTLINELAVILPGIWLGAFYSAYGFLLTVLLLLVVVCAVVSVILTYTRLRVEDWNWWWKAFFASGSTGICVFLYSVNFVVFDPLHGMKELVSITLCTGYSMIMAIAVMLATGAIGFLVSFYFVHCLYSSLKIS